jgi:hypothetical protein
VFLLIKHHALKKYQGVGVEFYAALISVSHEGKRSASKAGISTLSKSNKAKIRISDKIARQYVTIREDESMVTI